MSIRDQPPEKLLQQALRLVELGRLETARKLLKLAALKAPGDGTIQATLSQVEHALQAEPPADEDTDHASLEVLFADTEELVERGDLDGAARNLQVLVAARPDDKRFRALGAAVRSRRAGRSRKDVGLDFETKEKLKAHVEARDWQGAEARLRQRIQSHPDSAELHLQLALVLLHGAEDPKRAVPEARQAAELAPDRLDAQVTLLQALKGAGQGAAAGAVRAEVDRLAKETDTNPQAVRIELRAPFERELRVAAVSTPTAGGGGRWKAAAAAALMLAAGATGGGMWWSMQPAAVDVAPYQQQLPVQEALQMPKATELKLRVADADWRPLDAETKEAKLLALRAIAGEQGYEAVFLEGASGAILGSATAELVWVP